MVKTTRRTTRPAIRDRHAEAFRLWLDGHTQKQIAAQMGSSQPRVSTWIRDELLRNGQHVVRVRRIPILASYVAGDLEAAS